MEYAAISHYKNLYIDLHDLTTPSTLCTLLPLHFALGQHNGRRDSRAHSPEHPRSEVAEMDLLRHVLQPLPPKPLLILLVRSHVQVERVVSVCHDTSLLPFPRVHGRCMSGKTTTSCSLAIQLATCRESVLLIVSPACVLYPRIHPQKRSTSVHRPRP